MTMKSLSGKKSINVSVALLVDVFWADGLKWFFMCFIWVTMISVDRKWKVWCVYCHLPFTLRRFLVALDICINYSQVAYRQDLSTCWKIWNTSNKAFSFEYYLGKTIRWFVFYCRLLNLFDIKKVLEQWTSLYLS